MAERSAIRNACEAPTPAPYVYLYTIMPIGSECRHAAQFQHAGVAAQGGLCVSPVRPLSVSMIRQHEGMISPPGEAAASCRLRHAVQQTLFVGAPIFTARLTAQRKCFFAKPMRRYTTAALSLRSSLYEARATAQQCCPEKPALRRRRRVLPQCVRRQWFTRECFGPRRYVVKCRRHA